MSSNNNHLIKCKNDIIELAQSSLFKKELKDKNYMIDWSQKTITDYYKFCLQHHVIPKLDPNTYTLELIGPRDAVIFLNKKKENLFYVFVFIYLGS